MPSVVNQSKKHIDEEVCSFGSCKLPAHTHNYAAQFIYLILAYVFLIRHISEFNATNIVLFIIPIAIDLAFSNKCKGFPRIIQLILYFIVIFCSFIGVSSIFGFFETTETSFIVNPDAVLFSGLELSKEALACILLVSIFTPYILAVGTVTRKDLETIRRINSIEN